jgi:acyl carrier protein
VIAMGGNTSDKIKNILVERFGVDPAKLHSNVNLHADLNFDSMDSVDLLLALNDAFSIRISEDVFKKVYTVADLVDAVEAGISNRASGIR